jgi:hypothetical protein
MDLRERERERERKRMINDKIDNVLRNLAINIPYSIF